MKFKLFTTVAILMLLVGCSSSPYTYHVEPTPLKEGITKYELKSVKVNLTDQSIKDDEAVFATESELTKHFEDALIKHMTSLDILTDDTNKADASISIVIDYFRKFNSGGKALNKPDVSHSVIAEKDEQKLASFGVSNYTTKFGYLKDAAVNFEIAAFKWDAEDEKEQDVDLISAIIAEDIKKLGK